MMCCGSGGAAQSVASPSPQKSSPKPYFDWRDKNEDEKVSLLRVPSLVELDGDVFAVAEAHCTKKEEGGFTGIASEVLELTGQNRKEELDKTKVKTQVLEECSSDEKCACRIADQVDSQSQTTVYVSRPTTVVKGSDIYMLAGNYSNKGASDDRAGGWGLMLVKGNVSDGEKGKRIYWNDTYGLPWNYKVEQHESLMRLIGSGGSGVQMEDGTLVFPLEGTKKLNGAAEDGKTTTVSLIIHSLKDIASWKLSKGMSADGCSHPSVVEWEKDKLMMMTACDDGRRRVYESGDKGESWTEALGTLSRVWGNKKGEKVELVGSGFTTAKIGDNRDVMLITLPVYSKKAEKDNDEKGVLHLWLTDNTHIVDIGPVSEKDDDEVTASSLLYKSAESKDKDELIALYEKKKGVEETSSGMVSVLLTEQLEKVKEVLATWKKADERVSQLCTTSLAQKVTSSENACRADGKITDGLVGFLSGNFSENTWRDEYLGVDATVNNKGGATNTSDGVTFKGAWAEWPVGSQGQNQLYHFANYNFTLVATVSIDGEPKGDTPIPLLGVKMNGDEEGSKLMELSYGSGKKWKLLCSGKTTTEHSSTWDPETTKKDHVVILRRNGNQSSAYVDGKRLGDKQCEFDNADSKEISHFYIGGDGGSADDTRSQEELPVTVWNVLLYNRPLSSAEITALNKNKPSTPRTVADGKELVVVAYPPGVSVPAPRGTVPQSALGGNQPMAQELLKEGTDGGGASTTALSTVTTSPAGKESVDLLASGTSPGGTQAVDGVSSSDGNQTVDTADGGKTQEDEPHKTPADNANAADAKAPNSEGGLQDGFAVGPERTSGEDGETAGGTDGQEEEGIQPRIREVNAAALSSSLGNVSQGNNSDAGTVRGSGLLPSLL
ncbi:amastigote surface protein 4, partial [Trypanosoma cruzi]